MNMRITEIEFQALDRKNGGDFLGYVRIVFDNVFAVHGIHVLRRGKGFRVVMPYRHNHSGRPVDICHPISYEFRQYVVNETIKAVKSSRPDLFQDDRATGSPASSRP